MTERTVSEVFLDHAEWSEREARHLTRVEHFLGPRQERAERGEPHPVWDFLFTYYSLRPRQLRRWQPGYGVALAGPSERFAERTGYGWHRTAVTVTPEYLQSRIETVAFISELLRATASRPARLNCFGLHEWAMVYRTHDVRHGRVPLRLGNAGTDAVVESTPLRCSHFDAYRFFTEPAVPRNTDVLSRAEQVDREQPGCVHANMDLYKWCYKLGPLVSSELLMDCLDLAAEARALDMRASPYDLADYGFSPITIETPSGRAEYVRAQQALGERAAPLRAALLGWCGELLEAAGG